MTSVDAVTAVTDVDEVVVPEAATVFSGDPRVGVPPPPPEMETRRDKDKDASLDLVLYFFGEISSDEEDISTSSSKNGEVS